MTGYEVKQTHHALHLPWSSIESWCLAEGYENGDQRLPMSHSGSSYLFYVATLIQRRSVECFRLWRAASSSSIIIVLCVSAVRRCSLCNLIFVTKTRLPTIVLKSPVSSSVDWSPNSITPTSPKHPRDTCQGKVSEKSATCHGELARHGLRYVTGKSRKRFEFSNHRDMSRWFEKFPWLVGSKPVSVTASTRNGKIGDVRDKTQGSRWSRGQMNGDVAGCRARHLSLTSW